MKIAERFEYATGDDPALNYCLWPYQPPRPWEDKFRSINLLLHSFELAGLGGPAFDIVDALRDAIGPFQTVFGIKLHEGTLAWEFYFYDYGRAQRKVSMSRVIAALSPFAQSPVQPNESLPYFMFSLDLDAALVARKRGIDVVHMYVGNPGSSVSSGIAYAVRADRTELENFYFFFDAATQSEEAAQKVCSSAYFDPTRAPVDDVLLPELRTCQTICIANKRTHDCAYFSGVDVGQLGWFLERFGYPAEIQAFVREHRARLDHLLFDVGVDYRMEAGRVTCLKSGYYGVF